MVVALPERFVVNRRSTIRTFCRRCGSCLYQGIGLAHYVCAGVVDDLDLTSGFDIHGDDTAPAGDAAWAGDDAGMPGRAPEGIEMCEPEGH